MSYKFKEVLSYLSTKIYITTFKPSVIYWVLKLSKSFDNDNYKKIIFDLESKWEKLTYKDLILIWKQY